MTSYYIGTIVFGEFSIDTLNAPRDYTPLAVIQNIKEVREFNTEEEVFDYCEELGYDYIQVDGEVDDNGVEYEIAFKKH